MQLNNQKLFFQQFVENFFHVGAVLPSSSALGQAGAAYLAQRKRSQGAVRVLEAGAGTGSFTKEIVPLLQAGDSLDIVEINLSLTAYLKQRFQRESAFQTKGVNIHLVNADLLHFPFHNYYDYIIFSLPLTNFPPSMVKEILTLMIEHLRPGGVFSYVKYIFIGHLKYNFGGATVKAKMDENQAIINQFAKQYQIERRAVLRNVPPAWVHYWQKPFVSR